MMRSFTFHMFDFLTFHFTWSPPPCPLLGVIWQAFKIQLQPKIFLIALILAEKDLPCGTTDYDDNVEFHAHAVPQSKPRGK